MFEFERGIDSESDRENGCRRDIMKKRDKHDRNEEICYVHMFFLTFNVRGKRHKFSLIGSHFNYL